MFYERSSRTASRKEVRAVNVGDGKTAKLFRSDWRRKLDDSWKKSPSATENVCMVTHYYGSKVQARVSDFFDKFNGE
jgi:hypothetical protein